jgi:hypothetical protein
LLVLAVLGVFIAFFGGASSYIDYIYYIDGYLGFCELNDMRPGSNNILMVEEVDGIAREG